MKKIKSITFRDLDQLAFQAGTSDQDKKIVLIMGKVNELINAVNELSKPKVTS